jgi:hypothetical protein
MSILDNFFGFSIRKKEQAKQNSPVPAMDLEDVSVVASSGFGGTYYNLNFQTTDKSVLIDKYRELSLQGEIEAAIDEIVNEVIVTGDIEQPVSIAFKELPYSDEIKEVIQEEFKTILNLLDFNENGYEIFKRWYVDGRIYFQLLIDPQNIEDGITELRYIDPRKIEKIKEIEEVITSHGIRVEKVVNEFYTYEGGSSVNKDSGTGTIVKLPLDSVATSNSGLIDYSNNSMILSYLHKAIKPFNQLRMMEDALVIYRMVRAPERRVFKIEIPQGLPKGKGEQYLENLMNKYKNQVVYNSTTGDLRDDTKTLAMIEDFWIPVRDGKGADISTLAGAQNLGEVGDVDLIAKKLQRALNVPLSRLNAEASFNAGRTTEIEREEIKFTYFIKRLRTRFSILFADILRKQLILKNIITPDDWDTNIKNNIYFDYRKDSHFSEYIESEIVSRRIESAQQAIALGDEYYTPNYIKKHFLHLSDEQIKEMDYERVEKKGENEGDESSEEPMDFSSDSEVIPDDSFTTTGTGVSSMDDIEPENDSTTDEEPPVTGEPVVDIPVTT